MIKDILRGMIIGLANIIPGVSGGTMMVSMGIYDKLIYCINHLFRELKNNILFLLPIFCGMGIAIIGSAFGIDYLFEAFPIQTNLFFIGLILGSFPAIYSKVKYEPMKMGYMFSFLIFIAIVVGMALMNDVKGGDIVLGTGLVDMIKLFLVGILAAATMVIPGVSGSMMLLLLGYYNPILDCIKQFTVSVLEWNMEEIVGCMLILVPFGVGVVIGVFAIAKLIEIILAKFPLYAYWAILGLILASPIAILLVASFEEITLVGVIVGLVACGGGFFLSVNLGGEQEYQNDLKKV